MVARYEQMPFLPRSLEVKFGGSQSAATWNRMDDNIHVQAKWIFMTFLGHSVSFDWIRKQYLLSIAYMKLLQLFTSLKVVVSDSNSGGAGSGDCLRAWSTF